MHNPKFVLDIETHKLHWDFKIQTYHIISARQPDLVIVNKKNELAELWILPFLLITG